MIFVVGFLWLVLGPVCVLTIQISPEAGLRNATSVLIRSANNEVIPKPMTLIANRTLGTEISASERQRRLIPYMGFYLPPAEFPINQQYLVQVPSKQLQHQSPQKSQKQQHSTPAIPLPTAYVHMKVPINNQQSHHNAQNYHQAPVYQTIAYGGQHPLTQLKESNKVPSKIPPPSHSILPPAIGVALQRVPIRNLAKQKSAGPQQYYQQQPHQQQPVSTNSQKINLTPFTPTNSVPGHFIPIIYTNEQQPASSINYKPASQSSTSIAAHQPHQQQQYYQYNAVPAIGQLKEQHLQQYPSHSSTVYKQQQNPEDYLRQRPHGDVTLPESTVPSSELVPKTLSQIQQQDRQHVQYAAMQPTPGPSSSSNLRVLSEVPTENRHQYQQQLQQHQQQFSNTENLTPQQKYVLYLQQQLRYKQQQQLQDHQKENTQLEQHLQQQSPPPLHHQQQQQSPPPSHHQQQQQSPPPLHHQQQQQQQQIQQQQYHQIQQISEQQHNRHYPQPEPIYVVSTTASPPIPSTTAHLSTQSVDVHHEIHHGLNRFNEKYPQHSPISHVVQQHPEVITNPEQILHPRTQQKPSYPVAQPPETHKYIQHQLQPHQQYPNNYVEYAIDDPKQEIEEQSSPEKDQYHSIRPPPLLLGNNAIPPPLSPAVEVVVTSPRPLYKNQPTLRLHAISPTPNPSARPSYNPTPAQPMVFVSSKPKYTQLFPAASPEPVKLKPSQSFKDEDPLPDIKTSSLAEILKKLQESNHLPQTLTPDNIDNSIRTLIKILNNLKGSQTIVENPPQHHEEDYDYNNAGIEDEAAPAQQDLSAQMPSDKPGPDSGRPGIDYPTLESIPVTSFDCREQRYKGFFGDPETNCQVWHYCDLNGGKASFLCPNGTIFSQIALTCDWWYNVKCATTPQLYVLNERLYKYILPFTPKFPEDYNGPLVDKYLALKFKEMEEKMRLEKLKGRIDESGESGETDKDDDAEVSSEDAASTEAIMKNKKEGSRLSAIGEQSSEKNLLIDEENGRITSRGSVADTYSSTQVTTKDLPLSLQPIVVSTTASPFAKHSQDENEEHEAQRNGPLMGSADKISVEKVEVIEIKSDGTSGHLTPGNRYSSTDTNT